MKSEFVFQKRKEQLPANLDTPFIWARMLREVGWGWEPSGLQAVVTGGSEGAWELTPTPKNNTSGE